MATGYQYELGYDDSRFEIVVSQRFHCPICFLVLKDPVMCKNQHYGCSSCIKRHLENSEFCPTCLEPLSVDTLSPAPRIVTDYLSELNIHCDFYPRGCREVIQLTDLKRHVASCGFSPVQCSNDGCNVLVNARDKLHHEAQVCDFRKSRCHDCGQLNKEMKEVKIEMKAMKNEIKNETKGMKSGIKEMKSGMKEMKNEMKNEMKGVKSGMKEMKYEIKEEIKAKFQNEMKGMKEEMKGEIKEELEGMKEEIQGEVKGQMKEVITEMKGMKNEIKIEIKGVKKGVKGINEMKEAMKDEIKFEVKEEMKKEIREIVMSAMQGMMYERKDEKQSSQASSSSDRRASIIVAGGQYHELGEVYATGGGIDGYDVNISSVEMFHWPTQSWKKLNPMSTCRSHASSFMYEGYMTVVGGLSSEQYDDGNCTGSMESLSVADPAAKWRDSTAKLPVECYAHKVVRHHDQLIMSGGRVQSTEGKKWTYSDYVYEIQLVPPYASKLLTRFPQPRSYHGMEIFDEKLFILGGYDGENITNSVVQYDLIKNECKEMPPLPYAVADMATVLWRNNVLVIGGMDAKYSSLNKVAMYDVITGRSRMLPCMDCSRYGCAAVLTGNVVVVMGGRNGFGVFKAVECFDLERQVWQDLPDMTEVRANATAVVYG